MVAQIVGMTVQGKTNYAVWIGDRINPDNPRHVLGARLHNVYRTLTKAKAAVEALRSEQN